MRLHIFGMWLAAAVVLCGIVTLPCLAATQPFSGIAGEGGSPGTACLLRGNDTVFDSAIYGTLQPPIAHRGAHHEGICINGTFPSGGLNETRPYRFCNDTPPEDWNGSETYHDRIRFNMTPSTGLPNETRPCGICNGTPPADRPGKETCHDRIRFNMTPSTGLPNETRPCGICNGTPPADRPGKETDHDRIRFNMTPSTGIPNETRLYRFCNGTPRADWNTGAYQV